MSLSQTSVYHLHACNSDTKPESMSNTAHYWGWVSVPGDVVLKQRPAHIGTVSSSHTRHWYHPFP